MDQYSRDVIRLRVIEVEEIIVEALREQGYDPSGVEFLGDFGGAIVTLRKPKVSAGIPVLVGGNTK